MLVQFKFNNFKCFKEETILSLVASDDERTLKENCVQFADYDVLKGAVVYGSNASGKVAGGNPTEESVTTIFQLVGSIKNLTTTEEQYAQRKKEESIRKAQAAIDAVQL